MTDLSRRIKPASWYQAVINIWFFSITIALTLVMLTNYVSGQLTPFLSVCALSLWSVLVCPVYWAFISLELKANRIYLRLFALQRTYDGQTSITYTLKTHQGEVIKLHKFKHCKDSFVVRGNTNTWRSRIVLAHLSLLAETNPQRLPVVVW